MTLAPDSIPDPTDAQPPRPRKRSRFTHPIALKQSNRWSRAIAATLVGLTVIGIGWACIAQTEEAIPAIGKLEPEGTVKDVQVPINGVIKTVRVQDGQAVKRGEVLMTLDPTTAQAQLASLQKVRTALMQENQFYQAQLEGVDIPPTASIPPQFLTLSRSRAALVSDTAVLRSQLTGTGAIALSADQRDRIASNQAELETRTTAAQLEADQVRQQLVQTEAKLRSARNTLALNQKILHDVQPLAASGAISSIQYVKQQQEVETNQSEVNQLTAERARLQSAIAGADVKVKNTIAVDRKDLTRQISDNNQKIAEIESQFSKAIVENHKKIAELDSQIAQAQQTLQYGEVKAPADGVVFDLKAKTPGFVATSTEPVLKIVPDEALVAKVSITNQDIGFVREGMAVDVRIDSFPFSEFGDVKGTLTWIGSDALPPTQTQPLYTFPAKIKLARQTLSINGRNIRLQSGMSLNANLKIRKRNVMSIFTDQFTKVTESLNQVR